MVVRDITPAKVDAFIAQLAGGKVRKLWGGLRHERQRRLEPVERSVFDILSADNPWRVML